MVRAGVVGGRVEQQQGSQPRRPGRGGKPVGGHRSQVGACAVTAQGQPRRVPTPLRCVIGGPVDGGERVLQRSRVRMLRREAVLDRSDDHAGRLAQEAAKRVVRCNRASHPAATV
jgi:hypothetical protein